MKPIPINVVNWADLFEHLPEITDEMIHDWAFFRAFMWLISEKGHYLKPGEKPDYP